MLFDCGKIGEKWNLLNSIRIFAKFKVGVGHINQSLERIMFLVGSGFSIVKTN